MNIPEPLMKFASRKLLMALLGVGLTSLGLPLDPATQAQIVDLVMTYLFAQGGVDAMKAYMEGKKAQAPA